ncbi:hypothetical protein B296_00015100 [Ensete ventricosum]|uniref:GATA-type domain-containing protein n=1 Tax=Ensete ventricosum TaxID=4639 RepID=A0A427AE59_ENSVE|nr:hypothetical protein B296_00015100 [Ensete ventricosum]
MFHQDQDHQVQLSNAHHHQYHRQGQEWVGDTIKYLHLSPTYCSWQPNDPRLMTGSGRSSDDELVREAEHESSLRWTRKTVASDEPAAGRAGRVSRTPHHDSSSSSSPGGVIRFCSDCSTTKKRTSGPQGVQSLCIACGIRRRKARRAMATDAAAVSDGRRIPAETPQKLANRRRRRRSFDRGAQLSIRYSPRMKRMQPPC